MKLARHDVAQTAWTWVQLVHGSEGKVGLLFGMTWHLWALPIHHPYAAL